MKENELATAPAAEPRFVSAAESLGRLLGMPKEALQMALLRHCAPQGVGNADLMALCAAAQSLKLNPLLKEVYLVKQKGGRIELTVGIDGVLKSLHRHPDYISHRYEYVRGKDGKLVQVNCHFQKISPQLVRLGATGKEAIVELVAEAPMAEWYVSGTRRDGSSYDGPWQKFPQLMLEWKALRIGARNHFGLNVPDDSAYEEQPVVYADALVSDADEAQATAPISEPTAPEGLFDQVFGDADVGDGDAQPGRDEDEEQV